MPVPCIHATHRVSGILILRYPWDLSIEQGEWYPSGTYRFFGVGRDVVTAEFCLLRSCAPTWHTPTSTVLQNLVIFARLVAQRICSLSNALIQFAPLEPRHPTWDLVRQLLR